MMVGVDRPSLLTGGILILLKKQLLADPYVAGGEFADLAVTLYAEHDAQALLPFLRRDQNYSLEQALGVCQRMKLMKEVV
jgi:hypothetical protein